MATKGNTTAQPKQYTYFLSIVLVKDLSIIIRRCLSQVWSCCSWCGWSAERRSVRPSPCSSTPRTTSGTTSSNTTRRGAERKTRYVSFELWCLFYFLGLRQNWIYHKTQKGHSFKYHICFFLSSLLKSTFVKNGFSFGAMSVNFPSVDIFSFNMKCNYSQVIITSRTAQQ